MSGAGIVEVRGGIDVRSDDLRAAAAILADAAATVRGLAEGVTGAARDLLIYDMDLQAQATLGGPNQALAACDDAVRAARTLTWAADSYDDRESRIERIVGDVLGVTRNAIKAGVRHASDGRLDTPWGYDMDGVQALFWVLHNRTDLPRLGLLAWLIDGTGRPAITSTGIDNSTSGTTPPRAFGDMARRLAHVGSTGAADVALSFLECADGRRRVIVDLPGTATLVPGTDNPADLVAGFAALTGNSTAYAEGVLEILAQAGVSGDDEILLNGYSLGGLTAAYLARTLSASGTYNVAAIVTAGAPIGRSDIPADVTAIAVENISDPIPTLDGSPNADAPNVTTITVDTEAPVIDAHFLEHGYLPAAEAIEASGNPKVQHALDQIEPFLDAERMTTLTFTIERQ